MGIAEEDEAAAKKNLERVGYPTCHDFYDYGCRHCWRCYFCHHRIDRETWTWICPDGIRHTAEQVEVPEVIYRKGLAYLAATGERYQPKTTMREVPRPKGGEDGTE